MGTSAYNLRRILSIDQATDNRIINRFLRFRTEICAARPESVQKPHRL